MPVVLHRQENGYQIAVWQMQEALAELKQHPYALPFVQEASLFKSEQRQREWLSTRILLHNLLGRKVQIRYSSQGKPSLLESDYSLGISHSGEFVAIILSARRAVSIDLETPPYAQIHRVASRVFSPQEFFFPPAESQAYEPLLWCAKETLFKLVDWEGIDFRRDFKVAPFQLKPIKGSFHAQVYRAGEPVLNQELHYHRTQGFVYTYALQ